MNKFLKILSLLLLAMFALGCNLPKELDPFAGGLGIRMNVNGQRVISYDQESNGYADFPGPEKGTDVIYAFSKTMRMRQSGEETCEFTITATSPSRMIAGKAYDCTGRLSMSEGDIPLKGKLTFLTLEEDGIRVEAEFELSGTRAGKTYKVKHGFLRLKRMSGE